MADWRTAVLRRLGAPPTKQNLRFLSTWQRWEGGHTNNDARFNWLNTTRDAPGAIGTINSVGVQKFKSFDFGVQATAATLMNGRYDDIVAGLASGNPYKVKPIAGLSTWVSGSPTGNTKYAQKILGTQASLASQPTRQVSAPKLSPVGKAPDLGSWEWTMDFVFGKRDPAFAELMKTLSPFEDEVRSDAGPTHGGHNHAFGGTPRKVTGKTLQPGTSWAGTHVTDNLNWNNGKQTAVDIMADPGTSVLAPESGTVVRHGGAQGGSSLYFLSDSGHLYWMGHIENIIQPGGRVKRGQPVAVISGDHGAPHLHIDRYQGNGKDWFK